MTHSSAMLRKPYKIAEAIKGWLVNRHMRPGDRLPNELELIEMFRASKGTIREAVRILEAHGLLLTKTGPNGGIFVAGVSQAKAMSQLSHYYYFCPVSVDDVWQILMSLQVELAFNTAGSIPPPGLVRLQEAIDEVKYPSLYDGEMHIFKFIMRFHHVLAQESDNCLQRYFLQFAFRLVSEQVVVEKLDINSNKHTWDKLIDQQQSILIEIEKGDSQASRALMSRHLSELSRLLFDGRARLSKRFIQE